MVYFESIRLLSFLVPSRILGAAFSKNTAIKALSFCFSHERFSRAPLGAVVHTQSMLMCQDTATLSLVNTSAHITLRAAWYANRALGLEFGVREALKLNILLS